MRSVRESSEIYIFMKLFFKLSFIAFVAGSSIYAETEKPAMESVAKNELETQKDKLSYIFGRRVAESYQQQTNLDLKADKFIIGIRDMLEGKESKLDELAIAMVLEEQEISELPAEEQEKVRANLVKTNAYLAENAKKEGVKITASGLQYEVMKEGDPAGVNPKATDIVEVHYHGMLLDGKVFDSSVDRGEPTSFPLNRVIPGWTEGVQLMKPGSKYKFTIPARLAYGFSPRPGGDIQPGDALIFEVELLSVKEAN